MTILERILEVLRDLAIGQAHFATQWPGDIAHLVQQHPMIPASVMLVAPSQLDPTAFARLGSRLGYIAVASGMLAETGKRVLPLLPNASVFRLDGYAAESWTDIAAERPDIVELLRRHAAAVPPLAPLQGPDTAGEQAGIRYRVLGNGPPLVLTPLVLAPSQWEPVLPSLAEHFRVVALSGLHLGMLSLLEERAALADWRHMCAGLFNGLKLRRGDRVLDVGCGCGAVARQFCLQTEGAMPLTALDLSPYLLQQAAEASAKAVLPIEYRLGNAEELPFPGGSFDAAYSVTVLEECDATKAFAELKRVVRPGGRIGVIVRGVDLHQWWNLSLPVDIRAKISLPAASVAPCGVASADLYRMACAAGLLPERRFPYLVASESTNTPVVEYPETHAMTLLTLEEQAIYQAAKARAVADGTWFMTRGHHCFIGQVPEQ